MRNALKVGSVARIDIYLHWTFLALIAGILALYLLQGQSLPAALAGVGMVVALFGCVVLHELGHALTARRYGVPTRDITMYPIGGVARLQRLPEEPMKEFWIAIAGPAVNVAIAAVLALVLVATGMPLLPPAAEAMNLIGPQLNPLATLLWMNLILVGFNLLPAFPMDGGRVLRALLATRLDYARATQIAASVGQGMAILFAIVGMFNFNPVLLFIALFVYVGAQQESQQAMMRTLTQGIAVRQAMMTRFRTLTPADTLDRAVEELLAGSEQDFPVVEGGRLVGVLTRKELMQALGRHGPGATVGAFVSRDSHTVADTAMLDEAFERMRASGLSTIPVTRGEQLVGVLTLENVGELMMIESALQKAAGTGRSPRATS